MAFVAGARNNVITLQFAGVVQFIPGQKKITFLVNQATLLISEGPHVFWQTTSLKRVTSFNM